jgi:2-polyprenyl-6-methoxyphenol hydroxylase-like FAD-dependent oxidoreductase
MADQRSVEPILAEAARNLGASIRLGTRCVSVTPDEHGVTAELAEQGSGRLTQIRSGYVIAADGFRGAIREQVGIPRSGPGVIKHWVTFIIETDLSGIVRDRAMFWIVVNPEVGFGSVLSTSTPGQWAVSVGYDPEREEAADFTAERCAWLARKAIGRDVPLRVLDIAAWQEAVAVADRYRDGRVFLVGDSAHVWPAAGAMGANAAVQDAHNLAWKLAAVIGGWAGSELLDSYEEERRPAALALAAITTRRQEARFGSAAADDDVDDLLCIFGQRYRSGALIGASHETVYDEKLPDQAVPGMRAPHLWLGLDGRRVCLHDLVHDSFVLLTGSGGQAWAEAASGLRGHPAIPLRTYRVGAGSPGTELADVDGCWQARYGVGADGAVLIRPDGYVGWLCEAPGEDPAVLLPLALRRILARS